MADNKEVSSDVKTAEGGRIIFADDVVATIASLAAADVPGVFGMSGGVVEGFTEKLGRKNLTKGVKVEVGTEEVAVDLSCQIQYGYRIHDVCKNVQAAVKNAVETMTGLRAVEINVFVQGIAFEQPDAKEQKKKEKEAAKEAERVAKEAEKAAKEAEKAAAQEQACQPEPPRVK